MGNSELSIDEAVAEVGIPVDYFVSKEKKKDGLGGKRNLRFVDASGDLVFTVSTMPSGTYKTRLLLDASGELLISLRRIHNGSWQGFIKDANGSEDLIFRSERTVNTLNKIELDVFLVNDNIEESKPDLTIKGSAFYRACTIYKGSSIVAQTSLMHKLGLWKAYVPRSKFRLTIYPGLVNRALVVALIVIYFDGRKIWL